MTAKEPEMPKWRQVLRWWPYVLTVIYLGIGGIVLWDRWTEVGSLLEPPPANSGRLPLNSIGDILAGFFAPLAFLWLFVATQLQRQELKLQREELADTRAVLDDQKAELQKAALESNLQTSIMQRTMDSTRAKENYDMFNLALYYTSRNIYALRESVLEYEWKYVNHGHVSWMDAMFAPLGFGQEVDLSITDPSTIDDFFEKYQDQLRRGRLLIFDGKQAKIQNRHDNSAVYEIFRSTKESINALITSSMFAENELVKLRISGIGLVEINDHCDAMMDKIDCAKKI